ncbi:MAG: BACON domain-containing protein, partial [Bacteroidales bacterium]|nr:BACON domain-containing protein [Bacteroidales bacterium]
VSYYGLEKEVDVVQEHEGVSDDGITITVDPNAFVVDTEGGDFSFTYTVEGVLDPTVTCTTEQDWITDITDNAGTVSFTVAATTSHELRTGFITVTCGNHSKEVEIVQDRLDDASLSLDTDSITAEQKGGSYSFGYTLKNVGPGEIVTCSTDESWITDFDYSVEGVVTFTVAENTDYDPRTGVITVAYEEISKTVTVTQDPVNVDVSSFVGTYSCSGKVYNEGYNGYNDMSVDSEWDMKIYANEDGTLTISGLVPDTEEYYPESGAYIATATIYGRNVCVAYPQWTGYYTTSGSGPRQTKYYICWIQCPEEGYYSSSSGTCTFEFTSGEGVAIGSKWTSDTGLFLALNSSETSVSFYSYYDFFLPGMTFTKTSDSTEDAEPDSITPTSLKSLDARPFHTGAKLAK